MLNRQMKHMRSASSQKSATEQTLADHHQIILKESRKSMIDSTVKYSESALDRLNTQYPVLGKKIDLNNP